MGKSKNMVHGIATSLLLTATLFPLTIGAGNVKKSYVNLSKEGNQAQTSDFPLYYNQIETKFKNFSYDYAKGSLATIVGTPLSNYDHKFRQAMPFNSMRHVSVTPGIDLQKVFQKHSFTVETWIYFQAEKDKTHRDSSIKRNLGGFISRKIVPSPAPAHHRCS